MSFPPMSLEGQKVEVSESSPKQYTVCYHNNNSKKWDGCEIILDGDWLHTLYEPSELVPGKEVELPR